MAVKQLVVPISEARLDFTDWNIDRFTDFILRRGFKMNHYQAHFCACRSDVSRQPDALCPLCLNRGDSLVEAGEISVLVQTMTQRTGLETSGIWELGEAKATVHHDITIDEGDALVYRGYENRKREIIRIETGDVARLRFNFVTRVLRVSYTDKAALEAVKALDEAIYRGEASAAERAQRDLTVKESEVVLKPTEYRLKNDGNRSYLVFLGSRKPEPPAVISAVYMHFPEFVVYHLPQDDVDADQRIVQHRMVKRRDIADGDSSGEAPYQPRSIDDARISN
jgi:hypothetical protein